MSDMHGFLIATHLLTVSCEYDKKDKILNAQCLYVSHNLYQPPTQIGCDH